MARINLLGGAYQAKSIIADVQRCVNLYPEINPGDDQDHPVTHYPTPGTVLLQQGISSYTNVNTLVQGVGYVNGSYTNVPVVYDSSFASTVTSGQAYFTVNHTGSVQTITSTRGTGTGGTISYTVFGSVMSPISRILHGTGYLAGEFLTVLSPGNFSDVVLQVQASGSANFLGGSRCEYRATNGDFYRVVANTLYYVSSSWAHTPLGTIGTSSGICSMTDNGLVLVLVDGTTSGYAVDLTTKAFSRITSNVFVGSNRAEYLDTYFIFNTPGTNYWYSSLSNQTYAGLTGPPSGIQVGAILTPGSGYVNGTYANVPFTGGTGFGVVGNVTVSAGQVTGVSFSSIGTNFTIGDEITVSAAYLGGTGSGFVYQIQTLTGAGFDPLYYASKTASPDPIVVIGVVHAEIWLIGQLTTEVWIDAGGDAFPFQRLPGSFVEHGISAAASLARTDISLFWLSQDRQGQAIVVRTQGYAVDRISTHAIENTISQYSTITDALGYIYQQEGHIFYVLSFPTANATWVYDIATGLWHQRAVVDRNGDLLSVRGMLGAFVYGTNVVGDYYDGNLLATELGAYTDYIDGLGPNPDGSYPIPRIRSMPHMVQDFNRVSYKSFIADMETGTDTGISDLTSGTNPPNVSLRYSDDRGRTWGNPLEQSLGSQGSFLTNLKYNRLGMARDRVFELSWSAPTQTALQGAFIEVDSAST